MPYFGRCEDCGAFHEVDEELQQICMCGGEIPELPSVDVSSGGPVAEAIADKIGDLLHEQGLDQLVQSVDGTANYGINVKSLLKDPFELLGAARDALCEHHDEFDDPDAVSVVAIGGEAGGTTTLWYQDVEMPQDDAATQARGEA